MRKSFSTPHLLPSRDGKPDTLRTTSFKPGGEEMHFSLRGMFPNNSVHHPSHPKHDEKEAAGAGFDIDRKSRPGRRS